MTRLPTLQIDERFDQPPSAAAQQVLGALRSAVGQMLDRKRRLGQYAVVWHEGRVETLLPEALPIWPAAADAPKTPLSPPAPRIP